MISHLYIGFSDFERAYAFYAPLMACLGHTQRILDRERPWAVWQPAAGGRPLFIIGKPYDGASHDPGNGQMVALLAESRPIVDRAHAIALVHGGHDEGAPGLRPHYHASYYGAYFRDPDGNKLCVACHQPPA